MASEHKTNHLIAQVQVPADILWSRTGITLERGVQYHLCAHGSWYDASIECGPNGYELRQALPMYKWPIFWAAQPLKLMNTQERWFQLLGKIGDSVIEIGADKVLIAPFTGELLCAPNDARGFFGNNKGELTLTVTRKI
jgi:hypothetical protein